MGQVRWTVALAAAVIPFVVLARTLELGIGDAIFFGGFAVAPAALYAQLTGSQRRASVLALTVPLAAYVVLYIAGAPSYDTSSTGAIIFITTPTAGCGAIALAAALIAGFSAGGERLRALRQHARSSKRK